MRKSELVFGDPDVCRFYYVNTRTLEETRKWLIHRIWQSRLDDLGFWALTRKEDGELMGLVALQQYVARWIVWEDNPNSPYSTLDVEYSYALGKSHTGNGYVTEAGRALIDYAF